MHTQIGGFDQRNDQDCPSFRKYQNIVEIRTGLISMFHFCLLSFYVLTS